MKNYIVIAGVLLSGLLFCGQGFAMSFTADLQGANEVPPVSTDAWGTAQLELDAAQTELRYSFFMAGLDLWGLLPFYQELKNTITNAMIHSGPAGSNGPMVFDVFADDDLVLDFGNSTISGAWDADDTAVLKENLPALLSGNLYLNVHTVAYPAGEIRGQIIAVPEPAAVLLIGAGLVGLIGMGKRRN